MLPALNRHDQEAIASLMHHAGYIGLLELLASSERSALADAADEPDPAKLLRAVRFWQFLHKVNNWLATTPATIEAELDRLRADGQLDLDYPVSRYDAWRGRFQAPPDEEIGPDDTSDPASI
jgi:hypothetical protein